MVGIFKCTKTMKFEHKSLVNFWIKFGNGLVLFSFDELEYMTHKEDPWFNARMKEPRRNDSKNKISLKDIFLFYNELLRRRNNFKY